jgi:hypothetical protein
MPIKSRKPIRRVVSRKNKSVDINRINILRCLKELGSLNQNTIGISGRKFGVTGMRWKEMLYLLDKMCEDNWISKEQINVGRQVTVMYSIEEGGRNCLKQIDALLPLEELFKLDFFKDLKSEY